MSENLNLPEVGRVPMFSRPCYDKYHRCPGWAGGGTKYGKRTWCPSGRVDVDYERRWFKWRTHRCLTCGVLVLPSVVRWLDLGWWKWKLHVV